MFFVYNLRILLSFTGLKNLINTPNRAFFMNKKTLYIYGNRKISNK